MSAGVATVPPKSDDVDFSPTTIRVATVDTALLSSSNGNGAAVADREQEGRQCTWRRLTGVKGEQHEGQMLIGIQRAVDGRSASQRSMTSPGHAIRPGDNLTGAGISRRRTMRQMVTADRPVRAASSRREMYPGVL